MDTCVEDGRDHEPVARRAGGQQALDLGAAERALAAGLGLWALVTLEPLDRVGNDPTAPTSEGITLPSVASALAAVFAEQPLRRSATSNLATSSTLIEAIRRRPTAGRRWRSSW